MDWAGWVPESVVRDNKISELKMYSQGFLEKHTGGGGGLLTTIKKKFTSMYSA